MGLLDNMKPDIPAKPCRVRSILETLDDSDKKIFTDAIKDTRWSNRALAVAMTQRGLELSTSSLQKHKTGACSCLKA